MWDQRDDGMAQRAGWGEDTVRFLRRESASRGTAENTDSTWLIIQTHYAKLARRRSSASPSKIPTCERPDDPADVDLSAVRMNRVAESSGLPVDQTV